MYKKSWLYSILFLRYGTWWMLLLFFILGNFFPFYFARSSKSKNLKTTKKTPRDIIILHKCTKNHDHMLCYPWGMAHDTCNCCFSFWAIVFAFYPPNSPQKQNFKKMNLVILLLYTRVPKIMIRWCTVPEIGWATAGQTEKVTYRGGYPT